MEDFVMRKCENLLGSLGAYLDGELDPSLCSEIREHMKNCENCRLVVDNLEKTVRIFKAGKPIELPGDIRERLHKAVSGHWKKF